ncbi:hypothetical protein DSO57_1008770 [Entomophthora muscae]|uniref:Uncharacterized protein n=1 Tax=Entomophthora muscae TaxID=34485 RepID=A0ACC2UHX6_9FUNG|nr:hypothetical protein DSO57_1008770 [Entomophthora muscae]
MSKKKSSPSSEILPTTSPTKPTNRSTLFTKAIQGAAKHKYKAPEIKQQLEIIATALLEGAKMKKGKCKSRKFEARNGV